MHQRDSGQWVPGAPPGPDHHLIIPHPRELATEEGQVWVSGRHGHPVLGGVYGSTASGEPIEVVSYEWNEPMRYAVNRPRAEQHHLERAFPQNKVREVEVSATPLEFHDEIGWLSAANE
jgi:hypothetical protein